MPTLPTPSTAHLSFTTIYEPAEDTFLLLDLFSTPSEQSFLHTRFSPTASSSPTPLILELGTGSGVVIAFLNAHARTIFGRRDGVLTLGVDVNEEACRGTKQTVEAAGAAAAAAVEMGKGRGVGVGRYMASLCADLTSCLRDGEVDVLVFNPPYVPTETLPELPTSVTTEAKPPTTTSSESQEQAAEQAVRAAAAQAKFEREHHLLELSYAGGEDGMETTRRVLEGFPRLLSPRGVAYVLLCARNRPAEVKGWVEGWDGGWRVEVVAETGGKGGWERLVVLRIWREGMRADEGEDGGGGV